MVEAISVSGLKLVWDALVAVVRGYGTGKKDFFATHVEPLHQRILAIHKDYVRGFEEAKRYLQNGDSPPSAVIDFLEQRRRDYSVERDLAPKLAEELASAQRLLVRDDVWASLREYCSSVVGYFSSVSAVGGISWYTDFIESVKGKTRQGSSYVWGAPGISGNARQELFEEVKFVLDVGLPHALSPINTYYAVLRAHLL
jgi:hypothetical protein